ncbi:MAG: 1,4-alpha-glucan branching protein GlgB [Actinomycetota bacterium]
MNRAARIKSPLTDDDLYLFNEGSHYALAGRLGAVATPDGAWFSVWAPNAERVSAMGDFNGWDPASHPMEPREKAGIWETFVPGVSHGQCYKFHIEGRNGYRADKADPFALWAERPPRTASVVWNLEYDWNDGDWIRERARHNALDRPMSIYEMHVGSWRRAEENRPLTYRELAEQLPAYCTEMGFTHVELLPVMEHPFYGSWGYQTTGYFAPSARYGTPQDFMALVDALHAAGVAVILDWVPSHFATDAFGLSFFDGTHLYEHADARQGFHPDWRSCIFNYGRNEVRAFLMSSAMHWLENYHADGLRVDAVASMLYLDYSRAPGEWIPNEYGGNENLDSIRFLRRFNEDIFQAHGGVQTIAEESTAWPMVSRPTYVGGLGFGLKWDMGWMHDTLRYFSRDPIYRRFHHNDLTFRSVYQFAENFVMPLSHDEVVHGKGSMIGKMPGDDWQRFANLRALYGYMYTTPGKKLVFMGSEFGQCREWDHESSLDWHLLAFPPHEGLRRWLHDCNVVYAEQPALHEADTDPAGFEWIDANDTEQSVYSFLRKDRRGAAIACVLNLTPLPRFGYRIGVPSGGMWSELLNSDAADYWGSGMGNYAGVLAEGMPFHGRPYSITLTLPPLSCLVLQGPTP